MKLNEKAMLVNFSVRHWRAQKHDKRVSEEVAATHGTSEDMGRYNKFLVEREEVKAIQRVTNDARTFHYSMTLPWMDDGLRILTSAVYPEYLAKMQDFEGGFRQAVEEFKASFPRIVAQAKAKLNGLFREEDYPSPCKLARKFGYEVRFFPLPDKDDFRVFLAAEEVQEIQKSIQDSTNQAVVEAMKDLYQRLYDVVACMAERLSDADAIFRDSLVGNISKLCLLLPKLNLTGDPRLEEIRREVEEKLTKFDPATLREDRGARKQTASEADAILKKIQEVMG